MPFYRELSRTTKEGKRTLERLLELRRKLSEDIPARTLDNTILLATWNIRDFDKPTYGKRLEESYYYIAEIVSHFDIVAVQEVYKELSALERVSQILGGRWKKLFTDETVGEKGNDERGWPSCMTRASSPLKGSPASWCCPASRMRTGTSSLSPK